MTDNVFLGIKLKSDGAVTACWIVTALILLDLGFIVAANLGILGF